MPKHSEENDSRRMLKHLSAILEKSGVIIFEYHIKTDTLIRYDKELKVEVKIPKYCDYLRDKTRIYPDDRWKTIEFYSGRIKGPIDIREVDEDGCISRKRLETVSVEDEAGEPGILFGMVIDVTGEWHQEERLEHELDQLKEAGSPCNGCGGYPEYDQVTGLPSFNRFREEVDNVIASGKGENCLLVYTDLENFKYFNKKYGYAAGDQLLREFTDYIIDTLKKRNTAYFTRVVADQFILFFEEKWKDSSIDAINRINHGFIERQQKKYPEAKLRLRTGVYKVEKDCGGASFAIDAANYARHQIQDNSSKTVCIYDKTMADHQNMENEIATGIDKAIKNGEFKVYLQPRFSLTTGKIVGAESLVRWQKKDGTLLPPDSFIPVYEKNGCIIDLDFYMFEETVKLLAKWKEQGLPQCLISINASALHAQNSDTIHRYTTIIQKYGVDPSLTELELTETATVSDYDHVKHLFAKLQTAGFRTALDDFGAGYSVLNTVIDIPVNTVKVDRAFINNCETTHKGIYFLREIINLLKGLGYHIVCEGVETPEQAAILRNTMCDEVQGYWFSHPVPVSEFEKMLREGR